MESAAQMEVVVAEEWGLRLRDRVRRVRGLHVLPLACEWPDPLRTSRRRAMSDGTIHDPELEAELAEEAYYRFQLACDANAQDLTDEEVDRLVAASEAMVERWIYG